MSHTSRRKFLWQSTLGLAAAGVSGWMLKEGVGPTEACAEDHGYLALLQQEGSQRSGQAAQELKPTEDNILGPYYRAGAPYRAKVTPPLAEGIVMVMSGRVWGHDTRKPLAGAVLDIWQADTHGRYDNDDPKNPPAAGVFRNRTRVLTDETGYYEFETVHPGRYSIGPNQWRPSHIHYLVQAAGYKKLVTQLYFHGDPMNEQDRFIKPSLTIRLTEQKVGQQTLEVGQFDVVLAKA